MKPARRNLTPNQFYSLFSRHDGSAEPLFLKGRSTCASCNAFAHPVQKSVLRGRTSSRRCRFEERLRLLVLVADVHNSLADAHGNRFGTVGSTKLLHQRDDVIADSILADAKLVANLTVAQTMSRELQNLNLAGAKLGAGKPAGKLLGNMRWEPGAALLQAADGFNNLVHGGALKDVRHCAGFYRAEDVFVGMVGS